jgi:hypothetical protein
MRTQFVFALDFFNFGGDVGNFLIGSCAIRKSSMPVTTAENGRMAMNIVGKLVDAAMK